MGKAFLILADGTIFEGQSIGATGSTIGETVFTTGMTGYIETLTDPSYYGQIVTQTFPLVGNYGVIPCDYESKKSWVSGYIVRELCDSPSNFRSQGSLDAFLKAQKIVGIAGIDTRALTKKIRESGVMNGMILSGVECAPKIDESLLQKISSYKIQDAVQSVQGSSKEGEVSPCASASPAATLSPKGAAPLKSPAQGRHIVLWDFGAKANIQRELEKRGCRVTIVPCSASADDILSLNPDGIMLSNGPGDPAENSSIIREIKKIAEPAAQSSGRGPIPIFGICLGHQLLALARGCKTSKLKYGHRGANHPVKDERTGRVYITSQNHGYAVEAASIPSCAQVSFTNANDQTVEGLRYTDIPAFSVQFHPEACGGPHDTNFLFDEFLSLAR